MRYIFDLIPILIIIALIIIGKKNGFASMLVGLLRGIAAILIAAALSGVCAAIVYDWFVAPKIEAQVGEIISDNQNVIDTYSSIEQTCSKLGIVINDSDEGNSQSKTMKEIKNRINDGEKPETAVCNVVIRPVQISVIKPMAFTVIFIISFFLLGIAVKALRIINKIPLIGDVNQFFGQLLGFVEGLALAAIVCCLIVALAGAINSQTFNLDTIKETVIVKNIAGIFIKII